MRDTIRLFSLIFVLCAACLYLTGFESRMASEVVDLMVDTEGTQIVESETEALSGPELWDTLPMLTDVFKMQNGSVENGLYQVETQNQSNRDGKIVFLGTNFREGTNRFFLNCKFRPKPYGETLDADGEIVSISFTNQQEFIIVNIVGEPTKREDSAGLTTNVYYEFPSELIAVKMKTGEYLTPTFEEVPVFDTDVIQIDLVFSGSTYPTDAFTSADAAFDSDLFNILLEHAKEYNAEWCGQGSVEAPNTDNIFWFATEAAAEDFQHEVSNLYSEDLKASYSRRTDDLGTVFWDVRLNPRCF